MLISSKFKRIIASFIIIAMSTPTAFGVSSSIANSAVQKPAVSTLKLEGDISITELNPRVNISLRNSDVRQVLRMLADKAGLNIIFHESATGKVTLDLVNMPLNDAFKLVLQITNLTYYLDDKTLIITSAKEKDLNFSKQEITIIPIKNVDASLIANFLNKNIFSMGKPGFSSSEAAIVNTGKNELIIFGTKNDIQIAQKIVNQFDKPINTKTYTVNHTTPKEMANLVCNMLSPSSSTGGSTGGAAKISSTNKIKGVLTGAADDIVIGENLVACTIEPEGLADSDSQLSSIGTTNLSISYFPQRGTISVTGGSDYQIKIIEEFIKENDVKQPQAYLEIAIVELNEDGSKTFNNTWDFYGGGPFSGSFTNGTTSISRHSPGLGEITEYTTYIDENGKKAQDVLTYMERTSTLPMRISWQMQYILENQKGKILSNPKILITNGQEAVIDLTSDYIKSSQAEYLTTTTTGSSSIGVTQRTYEIGEDLGINIKLTPFISPEGYVTLNIEPDYTTEKSQVTDGPNIVATLLQRRNMELKNIRIKDNETLIIGGMMKESETKTVQKIPILGDLPLIGAIFRSTHTSKGKSEMIIMLTPRILKDDNETISNGL